MRGCLYTILLGASIVVPLTTHAQIVITDIVYDPPGADTGREWVQVQNVGTSSVVLTDLRLRTGGVNHKIVALSGAGEVAPQAHAAITQDQALFAQDVPSFSGTLFHASFSLTNKSGTVEIVDKSGAVIAAKSYQAPAPTPKPSKTQKPKTSKSHQQSASAHTASAEGRLVDDEGDSAGSALADPAPSAQTAVAAPAAQTHAGGNTTLWWISLLALAGAASVATFAARKVEKAEWEIEDDGNDV